MAKKKHKKKKSFTRTIVFAFMVFFVMVMAASVYNQNQTLNALKKEETVILQQIEKEKEKQLELQSRQNYYESDEYIEKVAREQLGLVKSGELVFINNAE